MIPMFLLLRMLCLAQDPFQVASHHYRLTLDNSHVRLVQVMYGARERSPMHDHPALPTLFIYTEDGGPLHFTNADGTENDRPPVKAGQMRLTGGFAERHSVENRSDGPNQYIRIEFKGKAVDLPKEPVRLAAAPISSGKAIAFENKMLRVFRLACEPHQQCPELSGRPAIWVPLHDPIVDADGRVGRPGEAVWSPPATRWQSSSDARVQVVAVELLTEPELR